MDEAVQQVMEKVRKHDYKLFRFYISTLKHFFRFDEENSSVHGK